MRHQKKQAFKKYKRKIQTRKKHKELSDYFTNHYKESPVLKLGMKDPNDVLVIKRIKESSDKKLTIYAYFKNSGTETKITFFNVKYND